MIKYWKGITNPKTGRLVSIRYDQKMNATEAVIRKQNKENKLNKGYLESCGASAFCSSMEGVGLLGYHNYPELNGKQIQMDDWVMMFLNDPKNDHLFNSGDVMDNRYMKNYVTLAKLLFNCEAKVFKDCNYLQVQHYISNGNAVQLCFIDPGHYIAAGDLNYKGEILTMNSWGTQPGLKNGGVNEVLTEHEYNTNVKEWCIVYFKPENGGFVE